MDPATVGYVSYRWHRICNPVSFAQLEVVMNVTDLAPGEPASDLGCGNGVVTAWLAERFGLAVTGVERFAAVADLARAEAARSAAAERIRIVDSPAFEHLAGCGPQRLLVALGAVDLLPNCPSPREVMARLTPVLAPGGWLLWGDPFWRAPATPRLQAAFGAQGYETLAGWVAAGEAAGLTPMHVSVSAESEWETFVWTMCRSLEDWASNAPAALATAARARASALRGLYLEEGRERLGFGLYLFQRPN